MVGRIYDHLLRFSNRKQQYVHRLNNQQQHLIFIFKASYTKPICIRALANLNPYSFGKLDIHQDGSSIVYPCLNVIHLYIF